MSSLNRVMLIGHLGRDPEVRAFQNGGKVCNLRLATSETWKDKSTGERKERTEWHSVAIMADGLCDVAERYLRKGSKVYVEGQLQTRKWQDQSGADRYTTEIVLRPYGGTLIMLDGKPSDDGDQRRGVEYSQGPGGGHGGDYSPGGLDDDIPFAPEVR